ncbi:hypothetical protein [Stieleria tagensis]|uniref:hypothetical protein n=1 Tax=Stieleria tagensis TaxID=2956795 RepID=UPI00209AE6D2|nr:hypothetical protein [Stieleria tagensis]
MSGQFNLIEVGDLLALLKGLNFRRNACGFLEMMFEFFFQLHFVRVHAIDSEDYQVTDKDRSLTEEPEKLLLSISPDSESPQKLTCTPRRVAKKTSLAADLVFCEFHGPFHPFCVGRPES